MSARRFTLLLLQALFHAFVAASFSAAAEPSALSPSAALRLAYEANPEIAASVARAAAEESATKGQYAPANPRFGWMREMGMNGEEDAMMEPMNSWVISQEFMFPSKYFIMGSAQKSRAHAAQKATEGKRLEIRQKLLTAYYGLYSSRRMLALLEAQRETLREIARSAEARRATGMVPQQDEMKAHVEQTLNENQIIIQEQEVAQMEAMLNALLGRPTTQPITLERKDLTAPKLTVSTDKIEALALEHSRSLQSEKAMLEEAEKMRSLARWSYAPDLMLSYQKPFTGALDGAYAFSIELSLPLWFFLKQSSENSAASARLIAAEKNLEFMTRETQADVKSLTAKSVGFTKLIQIYETSLIPQASTTLNASRAAYSAGQVEFMGLLDSERSLYEVRMGYFSTLAKYIEALTQLEGVAGVSLSTLPFGDPQ